MKELENLLNALLNLLNASFCSVSLFVVVLAFWVRFLYSILVPEAFVDLLVFLRVDHWSVLAILLLFWAPTRGMMHCWDVCLAPTRRGLPCCRGWNVWLQQDHCWGFDLFMHGWVRWIYALLLFIIVLNIVEALGLHVGIMVLDHASNFYMSMLLLFVDLFYMSLIVMWLLMFTLKILEHD